MPSRQELTSKLAKARQKLQKAQSRVAELEAQLFEETSIPSTQPDSEQRLRVLVEHAPAAIAMLDADMKYLLVSQRWLTDYHLNESSVIGRSHYEIFPDVPERWREIYQRCLKGAVESSESDPFPRTDGSLDWVRWEIHPWRNNHGDIGGIFIFSEVITERKLAEETLRRSETRFSSLVEAVEDYAICLLDTGGHVVSWNTGAERLKGYRSEEIFGQHFSRFYTSEDRQSEKPHRLLSIVETEGRTEDEGWRLRKDGSRFWANVVITALRNSDDSLYGFAKITRDLTERKRAEENIRKLHRTLSVLSDINQSIVRIRHLPSLFEKACEIAIEKGIFRMAWIGLFDKNTGRIDPVTHAGIADNDLERLISALNTQPLLDSFRTRGRLVCNDIQNDPRWLTWREEASRLGYYATVALPLIVAGEIRGIFNLYADELDFFDTEELRLMDEMAGDISLAMEMVEQDEQHSQAEAAVKRYAERMKILHEIDLGLIEATSIEAIFDAALIHIRNLFDCQQAIAVLFDYATNEAIVYAVNQSYPSIMQKGGRFPAALDRMETFGLKSITTFDDLDLLPDSYQNLQRLKREGMRSALLAQLTIQGHQVGLLSLSADTIGFFTAEHREIAGEIANQLAIAIHQKQLSEEIARHTVTLEHQVAERTADLQDALVRVEAILNNSPDAILLVHRDLTIQQANLSFNILFGSEWDTYFGKSLLSLLHPDDPHSASDLLEIAVNQQNRKQIEVRALRKNGTTFDAELSIGVIKGNGLVCIFRDITERKAQDRQLRYYASLQENVSDAVIAVDTEFHIQSWNKAAEHIYGWTADEVIGKTVRDVLHTQHPKGVSREIAKQELTNSHRWHNEVRQKHKNGNWLDILASVSQLTDENGVLIGAVAVNRDITERKAQERQLRYHASIQESVSDAVIATDMDFRIQSWNHAAETIYGWSTAEAIGKSADELLRTTYESEADRARILQDFLEHGAWQGEVIQRHRNGNPINILASVNLFKDEAGQPFGVVSVNRDITERKQVETALQKSSAEIHDLYNNAPCGYHSLDKDGLIVQINDTELRWLGYTRDEVVGRLRITDIFTAESVEVFRNEFPGFMERGWVNDLEFDVVRKDDSIMHILLNATAIYDDDGQYLKSRSTLFDITDLRQAQQAVVESEGRYRLLAENIADMIMTFSLDRVITYMSPSCERLLGYLPEEVEGKSHSEFIHPDDYPQVIEKTRQAVTAKEAFYTNQFRFRHKTGHYIWYEVRTRSVLDPNTGMVEQFISILRDITERRRADESLRASEERLRTIIENIPVMISFFDVEGRFEFVNQCWLDQVGWTVEDLASVENPLTLFYPDPEYRQHVLEYMLSAKPGWRDFNSQTKHRGERITSWANVRLSDGRGIGIGQDITERKQSEDAIRESEAKFRSLLDAAPIATIISDQSGHINLVNMQAETLFGYSRSELVGKMVEVLVPDYARDRHSHNRTTYLATPRVRPMGLDMELFARHKDGGDVPVEIQLSYIETHDGIMVMSFILDITKRKQAEHVLRQALVKEKELGELKTRFVSMASHEFRTPLATILAVTETLSAYRHKLTEEQIEQRFDKIKDQVGHLKDIMEDVLLLARMQARRVEFKPVKLDLDALTRSVLDEFQNRADVRHQLEYTVGKGSYEVLLDRKLMRQIISNVVSNAIKYSSEDKVVRIHLEHTHSVVILKISDEGIGIPEADLPHLFEPFHRAANVGAISGTGLGLVITKEAVELHGGTITVESQQGAGTTFIIRIPISTGGGENR
jgi:PAS domain S-box-containing protein